MSVKKFFCLLVLSASVCCLFSGCGRIRYYWYKLTHKQERERVWLTFEKEVVAISDGQFICDHELYGVRIPSNVRVIGRQAFKSSQLEEVVIEDGVEIIESEAFAGCEKLREVNIPKSVKTIGEGAFKGCPCEESVRSQFPAYK